MYITENRTCLTNCMGFENSTIVLSKCPWLIYRQLHPTFTFVALAGLCFATGPLDNLDWLHKAYNSVIYNPCLDFHHSRWTSGVSGILSLPGFALHGLSRPHQPTYNPLFDVPYQQHQLSVVSFFGNGVLGSAHSL